MTSAATAQKQYSPDEVRSIVASLLFVIILGALDKTIVVVAIPSIVGDLQHFELIAWVMSAYLIGMTIATPIYGKLSDMYGRRIVLSFAIVLFLVASVLCAVVDSMWLLIAGRFLQGLGGGGLTSVAQAAISDIVSPRERGRYQGYLSSTYAVASVAGPLVGGLLTQELSWRWVFWINLPVGIIAYVVVRRSLASLNVPHEKRPIDYLGAFLLVVTLLPFLIGVTRAGQGTPWLDQVNTALFAISMVMLVAFLRQETRAAEPVIPLQLFRSPTVSLCCLVMFVAFFQTVALSILVPLRLQMISDISVAAAAFQIVPLTLALPMGTYIAGRLMVSTGYFKSILVTGAALVPISLLGLAFADAESRLLTGLILAVGGFGMGLQFPTSMVAVQNSVPARQTGIATATMIFSRTLGAAIGVAVLTAILLATIHEHAPGARATLTGGNFMTEVLAGTKVAGEAGRQLLGAVEIGFRKIFIISAMIGLASLLCACAMPNSRLEGEVR